PSSLRPHSSFLFYYTSYISIYTLSLHDALPIYLMMPGMGLTAIGLGGVVLSYMGIANTFLTGMQALSGLTMFVGLVFLAAGILSGGVSTSGRAKATTLVIFGIAGSVGTYALSLNAVVTSLPRFVG